MGVEGFAVASTLVMIGYALGLLVAWGYDSGWGPVRSLAPVFLRSMLSAGVAAGLGWLVADAMVGEDPITILSALAVAAVAGLTTLGAFLGTSALLRSPEMRETLRR
jgi:hypothetical protein